MSHVDEGRLHAFLDGALSAADPADAERVELHLASCADCRARQDEAMRLREMASGLLGGARPREFVMPSFDAIRSRAALVAPAQRVKPSILRSPFNDFAWAAMVILAIGLGWMLNDTMEQESAPAMITYREIPIPPASSTAAQDETVFFTPVPSGDAAGGDAAPSPAAGSGPARQQDAPRLTDQAPALVERAPEYDVIEEDAAEAVLPPAAPVEAPSGDDGRDLAGITAERADARRSEPSRAAAPPPAAAQAADVDAAGAASGAPLGHLESGWRSVTLAEAQRLTGGHVVRLAGARILSIAARGSGQSLEVRSVQLTDRGESIRVVQRRAEQMEARRRESTAAESMAEAPGEVTAGLTVRVEDWAVTISGAVAPERLRELAAGLG